MVLNATYTPAPRGRRVRGNVCYLHAGPKREACAWYCILNAAYTPAPRGRRVCGTASALPPANRGGGHTPLMDRGSQLDTAAPHAAPPESAWREAESSWMGRATRRTAVGFHGQYEGTRVDVGMICQEGLLLWRPRAPRQAGVQV